jgi:hypothetical protein
MKLFTRIIVLFLLCFLTFQMASAQNSGDYAIKFHSGDFVPEENAGRIIKDRSLIAEAKFQQQYYLVLQFYKLPDQALKASLKQAGIELLDYLPSNAYLSILSENANWSLLQAAGLRSAFVLKGIQKTLPAFIKASFPPHAIKQAGTVDLRITCFERLESSRITASLQQMGAVILEESPLFKNITVRIPVNNFNQLLALSFISWIEAIDPPNVAENLLGRTLHRVNILNDGVRNLKGLGINIGIWDESEVDDHIDFSPISSRLSIQDNGTPSSHSTHCGGTIAGAGFINPKARGMAPRSKLYSWNFNGNIQNEMAAAIPAMGLSVSSHSYGSTLTCGLTGSGVAYSTTSRNTDLNLNTFPNHLHVHSAGNSQTSCTGGWSTITSSGKSAKNNILVANITSLEAISGSSSFGPVADGRVKPEISSFGTNVLSTYPDNQYATISGTSMATPGVAGTVALLVERYRQLNANAEPPSSLIKNTILNTAQDLGNAGPDYKFGYGRLNALEAVKILESNRYALNTINTGGSTDIIIPVPANAARLRVMLTWNDPAALANANPALVNNLDLTVINGSNTTLPFILDPNNPATPATRGVDNVSNIEQVIIDNPAAGNYTLRVTGSSIPTGPQQYSLTWSVEQPYIEVIFPNGGESLSGGVSETITWNNAGISGNQTVEYSLDNGANWNLLGNAIPPTTTRLTWTPPAGANTSIALVRVSSGSITDNSDANFNILGIPSGITSAGGGCIAGQMTISWSAITQATHYQLLRLDTTAGNFINVADNLTTTSFTISGLTVGAVYWFAVVAKNNTTGAVSERSIAQPITVSFSGVGTIGAVTGTSSVCGAANNIQYSIPAVTGATTYTWTVPAEITIVTGQGTNTILVNYSGANLSGNISVFASNGSCTTGTVNFAVTGFSNAIAAPATGGNQVVTHCNPNPMPTLTATATPPAGATLVWYNAAVGGSVVANPTLNSYNTVTYYAASVSIANGCEGGTRTPVTLTINPAPLPAVTASGPLVFCQGGSVTLSSNAGNSYSWSNGATTQSIIVTQSGNYSVTVNQGNGCISSSAPIAVQVNPLPAANISANGPTTFCNGGSVQLTASTASGYAWSNGASSQTITVTTAGNYNVTITDANGCSSISANTAVTVNALPTVTLTASPYTSLYPGLTTTLTATATNAQSYSWFKNNVLLPGVTGNTLVVNVDELGDYKVTVTAIGGCSNVSGIVPISDSAVTRLFVYPNPNRGEFQVAYYNGSNDKPTITIYDSKGARVFTKRYNLSTIYQRMDIDIRRNGKGVYHILVTDQNGKKIGTGSVVVQ